MGYTGEGMDLPKNRHVEQHKYNPWLSPYWAMYAEQKHCVNLEDKTLCDNL